MAYERGLKSLGGSIVSVRPRSEAPKIILKENINLVQTIIDEMLKGNFSFLILVVGIIQIIIMILKR